MSLFEYPQDFYWAGVERIRESKPTDLIGEFGIIRHECQSVRLERFREPQGSRTRDNEWLNDTGERRDIEPTSTFMGVDQRSEKVVPQHPSRKDGVGTEFEKQDMKE
jgi:hypothetical protein